MPVNSDSLEELSGTSFLSFCLRQGLTTWLKRPWDLLHSLGWCQTYTLLAPLLCARIPGVNLLREVLLPSSPPLPSPVVYAAPLCGNHCLSLFTVWPSRRRQFFVSFATVAPVSVLPAYTWCSINVCT